MRQLFSLRTTVCLVLFVTLCSFTPKSEEEQFIDSLLAQMTLEEKIGQMNQLDPSYESEAKEALIRAGKVGSIFKQTVRSVVGNGNLVIIKTLAGSANAVCAIIDSFNLEGVFGSIAGDDCIFVAAESNAVEGIVERFKAYLTAEK